MVCDIIAGSWAVRDSDVIASPAITMSPEVLVATEVLREFLFNRVYDPRSNLKEAERAREVIRLLYKYFKEHEDRLPPEYRLYSDGEEQRIVDYIAGMTDQYALRLAEELERQG